MTRLFFDTALLDHGWADDVRIDIDAAGWISDVRTGASEDGADFRARIAVPGMPNLHSHAFQRAMAGLTEIPTATADSFWTWRQVMYRFLERLTPDDLAAIAAQLYVEMLAAGFTAVAEFHYLHHDADGAPYDDLGAMSAAIGEAVAASGIGATLLPVFYANGGFGGAAPEDGQKRFINAPDRYARLLERVRDIARSLPDARVGIAPHSLRAVTPESLAAVTALCPDGPIHIHIAEQTSEVEHCLAWSGRRPVEWLLENSDVDRRWCLVHATHITPAERRGLARSGAVAGLCPVTEANLGDGIFDGAAYCAEGGLFGIGTDSNVAIGVADELRMLEYSQRLRDRGRNILANDASSTGRALYDRALAGGARAVGRRVGRLAQGYRGDIVSLDADHAAIHARRGDQWLDSWLFAGDNRVVADVFVGGDHLVVSGRHRDEIEIGTRFRKTLDRLQGS